jgi:hypothetical protein
MAAAWGSEVWFAHTAHYAGKILRVRAGCRLSIQYHEAKGRDFLPMSSAGG